MSFMSVSTKLVVLFLLGTLSIANASAASGELLTGKVDPAVLLERFSTFKEEYDDFQPSAMELDLIQTLQGGDMLVMFGTWCHDSEREVPRLLKLLETGEVTLQSLTLLAVDYDKKEPSGVARQHQLKYTPTFVLFKRGEELGRVIEKPTRSLAADLAQIANNSMNK